MSSAARFGMYGPNRYPPGAGYPPYPPFPQNRSRLPNSAIPGPHQDPNSNWNTPAHIPQPQPDGPQWSGQGPLPDDYHQTPLYPEDDVAFTPSGHPLGWSALPRDLRLDPEPGWGHAPGRPAPFHDWYAWPTGADQASARRPYAQLDHYSQNLDRRQSRHMWREELLRGDPDKAISDHALEASRLVISFITRGPTSHPHGQGDEILFFRARRKDPTRYQYAQDLRAAWSFLAIEASPLVPLDNEVIPSAEQLSKSSITGLIPTIDPDKDLKLVRRSRPLRWDTTTILESFLYRIADGKEDPESEAYKDLAERLGPELHYWTQLRGFQQAVDSDVVSTAMIAVCFPQALSMGIDDIYADQNSKADELSLKALDVLYLCVQGLYARTGFRFYPIPAPPVGQPDFELCNKRRVWAYWTEVMAWHLAQIRVDAQVSISYTLLKPLSAIKPSVDDPKVTLDDLEKLLINAIATEADRSRNATRILIREGVSEILLNPDLAPAGGASEKLHIITSSSSSIVYNVIAKLITHVLSRKGTSPEGGKSTSNRRVMDMKVTIAESRPLSEGVALAMRLSHVVDSYTEYRDRTAKTTKRTSAAPSIADLGPAALDNDLQARLRNLMLETEQMRSPNRLQSQTLGLAHLLADMDAKKEKKEPKVSIELITDAAAVSTILASGGAGSKPIILLSADRILANGDVVNKVGSAQMAWAGKTGGGVVLILCRADRVHSKSLSVPGKPSSPGDELVTGWKLIVGDKPIDDLVASSHVTISNPTYEDVSHEHITGYITELGMMKNDMLLEFSNMRSDFEKIVWPPTVLDK